MFLEEYSQAKTKAEKSRIVTRVYNLVREASPEGAFVTFEIDGVATDYTFSAGAAASFDVDVPSGTSQLVISYTSGAVEEEHIYTITTPDGDVRGPFGPNPSPCIN